MPKKLLTPDYVLEASWEVCNKVGGIYTVLSTRAKTLQQKMKDHVLFIGPDFWSNTPNPLFKENKMLLAKWRRYAQREDGLDLRIGRWMIPGDPIAVLVDFEPFFAQKNDIYAWAWEHYGVDSLHAYGDYDEASMFAWAAGRVAESFYRFNGLDVTGQRMVFQTHEWMTCLGALYLQQKCPAVGTIFTTHATSIGRSIAGNQKPLYDCMDGYNGDQMAEELNMQSKHSIEKQTAHNVGCFTTVSDITDRECRQLLEREADVVLMNGFENGFVPKPGKAFDTARKQARSRLLSVANALMGTSMGDDTLIVSIGGRYEYKNKGIDMFVDAMNRLRHDARLEREVLAFVMVPAWVKEPRTDLQRRLKGRNAGEPLPLGDPRITHNLNNQEQDMVLNQMNWLGMYNHPSDRVKVVFVPCYLDGQDGVLDMTYYDLLVGMDLCIYPSYYEPWGYTPLESVAFHVPCITTDLAGFGLWVQSLKVGDSLSDGVYVVHRTDQNFDRAATDIRDAVLDFCRMDASQVESARKNAAALAEKALWKHFIKFYYQAYDIALRKRLTP